MKQREREKRLLMPNNKYKVNIVIGGAIVILLCFYGLSKAMGQDPSRKVGCVPREKGLSVLEDLYKESVIFRGISQKGHITLIHLNEDTGSWSANIILPSNVTEICLVDSGTVGEVVGPTVTNKDKEVSK